MSHGIAGIERKIKQQQAETDKNINEAFQDLSRLMEKASDMARLAQGMVQRLKEKGNKEISQDETVLFKSYLLNLGINEGLEDLVTREKYANDSHYYRDLGKQVALVIKPMIEKSDGIMALTDVFCAVNRSRGLDLISSEDLLNACYTLKNQKLGYSLFKYDSGLMVIQADNFNQENLNKETLKVIEETCSDTVSPGLTAHQLALRLGISLSLARQRLLNCENQGFACRDESIQGLAFFPNKFLCQ
ncbi:vacuolar protein-sorting-associated protein 36 [Tetranychus urticae]|uniref:Vacuolar protein-sorting-associated protein 36 n=1 Tax=Tetranychus urticae TaxID=32264 RepID=T1K803_TETUR|nr:vacuolar protein-sorting-associated protein 36 [Tetranychus urticae]